MKKEVILDKELNSIKYYLGETLLLDFNLDDINAIGEVTTDVGPFVDDHFIIFITKTKMWNPIPTDATGFEVLTEYVGANFNIVSFIQIANRNDFKSRIIYPKSLEGKEFITLESIAPKNWTEKIGMWFGFRDKYKVVAISEVYDKIKPEIDNQT